ncbi:MAG: phosphodiester glycosidase family protein [Propionibacteriaceae bacterium]
MRLLIMASALVLALLVPVVSLGRAVATPGTDTAAAKAAEWARGHGLGFAVTAAEEIAYRLNPPRIGGTPDPSLLTPATGGGVTGDHPTSGTEHGATTHVRSVLRTLVQPALPGEGRFVTVVGSKRVPAVQLAYLRPDDVHTSYLAAVLVMSRGAVRFVQHPGYAEPGQLPRWRQADSLTSSSQVGLAATFNGGFKLKDARGGFYANGHTAGTLRSGAASMVITKDGKLNVGSWNHEVQMSSEVASVRQNLRLLIDHGTIVPNVQANTQADWGATVKNADFVWRSGVGVDKYGNAINVVGPALSAPSLASILLRAGAVRAMELDINKTWVSTMWYSTTGGQPNPHKVLPFQRPADRYFTPTSRDFVAAYVR